MRRLSHLKRPFEAAHEEVTIVVAHRRPKPLDGLQSFVGRSRTILRKRKANVAAEGAGDPSGS